MQNNIQYPVIGSTGNWGQIVNNNFRILDDNIRRISGDVKSIASFSGFQLPYIQWHTDTNSNNEYKFVDWVKEGGVTGFKFYTNVVKNGKVYSGSGAHQGPIANWQSDPTIKTNTAAYLINNLVEGVNGSPITASQGDLLVFTVEVGSITGESNTKQIKIYPDTGIWMKPVALSATNQLSFEQTNYVEWAARAYSKENTITLDIPTRQFYCIGIINLTVSNADKDLDLNDKYILKLNTHYIGSMFDKTKTNLYKTLNEEKCIIHLIQPQNKGTVADWHVHFTLESKTPDSQGNTVKVCEQPINLTYDLTEEVNGDMIDFKCTFDIQTIQNFINTDCYLVCYISFLQGSE